MGVFSKDGKKTVMHKCAFAVHPLVFDDLMKLPWCNLADQLGFTHTEIEKAAWRAVPIVSAGRIIVPGANGTKADCAIWGITMTPDEMQANPKEAVKYLRQIVKLTGRWHQARLLGLGAMTGIVDGGGQRLADWARMGITTGNSLTAGIVVSMAALLAERLKWDLFSETAAVVGAAGSIGRVASFLLVERGVKKLYLVGRPTNKQRLEKIAEEIHAVYPGVILLVSYTSNDDWTEARLVITASSDKNPIIDARRFLEKGGAVVTVDAASPQDVDPESAKDLGWVLSIDGGRVRLPDGTQQTADISLPPLVVYACLAETLLLTLEGHTSDFTLGNIIELDKVRMVLALAEKHGFRLADPLSFGRLVSDERFEKFMQYI